MLGILLETLFPGRCLACGHLSRDQPFCPECATLVEPAPSFACDRCGRPLPPRPGPRLCLGCLVRPDLEALPDRLLFAAVYGGPVRDAILRFKHGGRIEFGRRLGALVGAAVIESRLPLPDLLLPVPLHPRRLRYRGYDQALVLAREVGRILRRPVATGLLVRGQDTPSLRGLDSRRRFEAVGRAFELARPELVTGRAVLLIDDVAASLATLSACTRTLRSASPAAVAAAVVARAEEP